MTVLDNIISVSVLSKANVLNVNTVYIILLYYYYY